VREHFDNSVISSLERPRLALAVNGVDFIDLDVLVHPTVNKVGRVRVPSRAANRLFAD
jgi:hypothetical protein